MDDLKTGIQEDMKKNEVYLWPNQNHEFFDGWGG